MAHEAVRIAVRGVALDGDLARPMHSGGIVLFAHGSGSSRHSPRNQRVADHLQQAHLGTLLMDLLTAAANANDSTLFEAVLDDIPPILIPTGAAGTDRARSTPTRPTIIAAVAATCADEGSARGPLGVASSPPSGWAVTAGPSSAPGPGLAAGGGCASATSLLRALLRLGHAGLLGHLLQRASAAAMVTVSADHQRSTPVTAPEASVR
jgi:hypothetical protein